MGENITFPNFRVDNKIALITGGNKGIGRACALALANAGANIVITARDFDELEKVKKEIEILGSEVITLKFDITEFSRVPEIIKVIIDKFGKIDILINNAGICFRELALEVSEKTWDSTFDVNLKGLFFITKEVAKYMIKQKKGKIINISSMNSITGLLGHVSYNASKAGISGLTKVLAMEWGRYRINVNSIAPTFTQTEMASHIFKNKDKYNEIINNIPLRRLADPMEIGAAVVFLASAASDFITGELLLVDGGWTAGKELKNV
ncbi:MAG: glucose 1-dehydrogenase [Atribacterota bacterium]|nr:glucose 1-dehydrogenase [Atribacterota bacterium]